MKPLPETLIRFSHKLPGASNWSHVLKRGTTLRLTDIEGGANVSALFYNFELLVERYNMPDTLKAQHVAFLTTGCALYSDMGRILASIPQDTHGWHDTITGHSTAATVAKKYGEKTYQEARNESHRNTRDGFLMELAKYGMGAKDIVPNVNFFSMITVQEGGGLVFDSGAAKAGAWVDVRAEMNTLVVLNSCPHPLDTNPAYEPKPVMLTVWESPAPAADDVVRTFRPENERGFTNTEHYFL